MILVTDLITIDNKIVTCISHTYYSEDKIKCHKDTKFFQFLFARSYRSFKILSVVRRKFMTPKLMKPTNPTKTNKRN